MDAGRVGRNPVDTRSGADQLRRMERKDHIDRFGAAALVGISLLLAFNQVVIKVSNDGFQPVFNAGLRSAGAVVCLALWLWWRGRPLGLGGRDIWLLGVLSGLVFTLEFILLFSALDRTTVARSSVIFYSMPVWMALGAHFLLPGDGLSRRKIAGLIFAMAGVVLALIDRSDGSASLLGDVMALGAAMCWAAIGLMIKGTRLNTLAAEGQLMWQVIVSALALLVLAPLFGPLTRGVEALHVAGLLFQIIAVASFGFVAWFWLLARYPASGVASFAFLAPVFGVALGWLLLSEPVSVTLGLALAPVAVGIVLINRPARRPSRPGLKADQSSGT